jgi:hypothetical protein
VYRVAELQGGFAGELANDEVMFMVFEGPMIMVAVIAMTIFHPGFCFAGTWTEAKPVSRRREKKEKIKVAEEQLLV